MQEFFFSWKCSISVCCFSSLIWVLILDYWQVSTGYFFSDLGMICWLYPSLGGLEYVSIICFFKVELWLLQDMDILEAMKFSSKSYYN